MQYTKMCSKCRIVKNVEEFHFINKEKGIRRASCNDCQAKYIQKYKSDNYEKIRGKWRVASKKYLVGDRKKNKTLKQYGITVDDYNKMYDSQEGKCKICSSELTLCVDHCHTTGKIRGLLCNQCNVGIGCFKDDIILLSKVINYLK